MTSGEWLVASTSQRLNGLTAGTSGEWLVASTSQRLKGIRQLSVFTGDLVPGDMVTFFRVCV